MKTLTKKPGQFRAVCKQGAWLPLDELSAEQRAAVEAGDLPSRWDKKLKCEVAAVPCTLDTDDRGAFERHMLEVHGKKPRGPRQLKQGMGLWHGPRLADEGQPLKVAVNAVAETVRTCSCGLVGDVLDEAGRLWWAEHEAFCAERRAA